MTSNQWLQIGIFFVLLTSLAVPLGNWLGHLLRENKSVSSRYEQRTGTEMSWQTYCAALMSFSFVCLTVLFFILRFQAHLPINPQNFSNLSTALAFNTAVSFVTNTNWQAYGGETTLSLFSQMVGLTVQNFLSASVGLCVLAALFRGFARKQTLTVGNFWRDLHSTTVCYLLPLSILVAVLLISQGVPQTFHSSQSYSTYESSAGATLATGPVASQIAIKQLGTNGGGYYNVNSAHPFENPTPLSNLIEMLSILLIPAACCFAFGKFIADKRQAWLIYGVMLFVLVTATIGTTYYETHPRYHADSKLSILSTDTAPGGNMEGKETRFGVVGSTIWAAATTAASNGSVNAMHDSFTPIGGMIPMSLMKLGETIFGGVGSGLYGMLAFVILTVFIAGLMVGRTPEYLGKKIEVFEMKMVSLIVLIPCVLVLAGSAIATVGELGVKSVFNPGPHGFSEILYAYGSMGNNNGSAFGGFAAGLPIHLILGSIVMFLSRFGIIIPVLALAGSLAKKNKIPNSSGTLETHTPLFAVLLLGIILVVGALTFMPAIILGPVVEHLASTQL